MAVSTHSDGNSMEEIQSSKGGLVSVNGAKDCLNSVRTASSIKSSRKTRYPFLCDLNGNFSEFLVTDFKDLRNAIENENRLYNAKYSIKYYSGGQSFIM